jgi:hypothetical protein
MTALLRAALAATLFAAFFASPARGEAVLSVNVVPGVFDQPSMVLDGNAAHVAFIGADDIAGPFLVYYAAVDGGADFGNLNLIADNILLTQPVPVLDTAGSPDNTYTDARHPKIARRTASELVIFFQARPNAGDNAYRLFQAIIPIDNNQVVSQSVSVREVLGVTTGDIHDVSFGLVAADNTARVAYANRPTADPGVPFQVYYAKIDIVSAAAIEEPIPLSVTGSGGFRPVPSLKLDGLNRAHVAWVSNHSDPDSGPIFYAMVNSGGNGIAIPAIQVLGGRTSWDHPSVLVSANNSVIVIAADADNPEKAGEVGAVEINPDAPPSFLLREKILDANSRVYRPEAFLDAKQRIHVTGYGSPPPAVGISGTGGVYYVVSLSTLFTTPEFVRPRTGFGREGLELPGDYTKAAFGFLNGKTIVFWSGLAEDGTNRDLRVTTVPSVFDAPPTQESGCTIVRNRDRGASGRIPGDLLILLPAIVLGFRRFLRRRLAT